MISDACIVAECDNCGYTTRIGPTVTARGNYSDGHIEGGLKDLGWVFDNIDGEMFCCQKCKDQHLEKNT